MGDIDEAVEMLASIELSAADLAVRTKRSDAGTLEVVVQFRCTPDIEALVQLFRLGRNPGPMLVRIRATQFEMIR